jgi:putative MATE family efflux protein
MERHFVQNRPRKRQRNPFPLGTTTAHTIPESADNNNNNNHHHSISNVTSTTEASQLVLSSLTRQTTTIAIPALIGMLADPVLSLIDTAYVGRLGSVPLAALGACTSIFHLAFNAFRATTAATTSLVSSRLQQDEQKAREVTQTSLLLGVTMGLAVAVTLWAAGRPILASMGVPSDSVLFPDACAYLYARCGAAPVVLWIGVAEGAFRGYGDTIVPLVASLTAAAINLVLDPILMFTLGWGVRGAAAATALAQFGAAIVYAVQLKRRNMLPALRRRSQSSVSSAATVTTNQKTAAAPALPSTSASSTATTTSRWDVIRTILGANVAMMTKQGSLLLAWAYATAKATRMGAAHVAAHQVGLSVWLVFALILDGAAVAAQVLASRAYANRDRAAVRTLLWYFTKVALLQGVVSLLLVDGLDWVLPGLFTPDRTVQAHLHRLVPYLAAQQVLVSLTLVWESLAVGAQEFRSLAVGTTLATVASVYQLRQQTTVEGIWKVGIVTLFAGRLLTAAVANIRAYRKLPRQTA